MLLQNFYFITALNPYKSLFYIKKIPFHYLLMMFLILYLENLNFNSLYKF